MLIFVACSNGVFHDIIAAKFEMKELVFMLSENIKAIRKLKGLHKRNYL